MKTFTTYAEKKAKQILNLLQGYTKGIRITAILILLLMGVSNAWAVDHSGGYIYFLKPSTWTESKVMMFIGHDSYTSVFEMTKVDNTDNLYRYTMPSWGGATYVAFANDSYVWGTGKWGPSNRTNAKHYTNVYNNYGFNNGSYYIVVPASTSNNAGITINYKSSASNLNLTTRANVYGSTDGGSTYASKAAAGTVSVSGYYMSNYSTASTRSAVSSTASQAYASATLAPGSTATFEATAKTGYEFVGWFTAASGGTAVSTDAKYTFKYDISYASKTLYARFKQKQHTVLFGVHSSGHGSLTAKIENTSISSNSKVNYGSTIVFTATPSTGYQIEGWYKNSDCTTSLGNGTNNTYTVTITGGTNVYVRFKANQYDITYKDKNNATFSGAHADGHPTTHTYGTATTLKDATKTGYTFGGWHTDAACANKVTSLGATAYTADITLYAKWTAKTYTITLDANGGESNGSATATYNSSNITNLTHPTYTDYRCDGYYTATSGGTLVLNIDGTLAKNVSGYTDANGNWTKDGNATLYAQWTYDVTEYTVTFGAGTGFTSYGSVTAKNNSTSAAITSPATVRSGQNITFTATPKTGYIVEGWYTNAACTTGKHNAGSTTYNTSITAATNVYVKFVEKTWSVAFAAGNGGAVSPKETQTVGEANGVTIIATPNKGYTFAGWTSSNGGSFEDAKAEKTTFYPAAATTVTASFTENKYTIFVESSNKDFGTVSPESGSAGIDTKVTITAKPKLGYKFVNWTATNGITIADANSTTTTITASAGGTVTANFALIPPTTIYIKSDGNYADFKWNYNSKAYDMTLVDCGGTYYTADIAGGVSEITITGSNDFTTTTLTVPTDDNILYDLTSTTHLYLKPNSNWTQSNARFAAYVWNNAGNAWLDMTDTDKDGIYECEIPATYTSVIFCRMNPKHSDNRWNNDQDTEDTKRLWNQTNDLEIPTDGKNQYTVTAGAWSNGSGTWSAIYDNNRWTTFTKPNLDVKINITGKGSIVIDGETYTSDSPGTTSFTISKAIKERITVGDITPAERWAYNNDAQIEMCDEKIALTTPHTITGPAAITLSFTQESCEVVFNLNLPKGVIIPSWSIANQTVAMDGTATEPTSVGEIGEYLFGGWYKNGSTFTDANKYDFSKPVTGDLTLYARWIPYTQCIFFKNNLNWSNVYVYTFKGDVWGNDGKGVYPANRHEYGQMTKIGQTDIYYYILNVQEGFNYIAFSDVDMHDAAPFNGNKAIYRGDRSDQMPLFIPQTDQTASTTNSTQYYSSGIWMKYNSTESGYVWKSDRYGWEDNTHQLTASTKGGYTFTTTVSLEGNTKYLFKINNIKNDWFGYTGTMTQDDCTKWHFTPDTDNATIQPNVTGDYVFTVYLGDGKVEVSLEYPLSVGDYRLAYYDAVTGFHPGHYIKKRNEDRRDTVSFFVHVENNPEIRLEHCTEIDANTSTATWVSDAVLYTGEDCGIETSGVYNFILQQSNSTAEVITDETHPYEGNYYIRTDAAAGGWDSFRQAGNKMTYTSYADNQGFGFNHYFVEWINAGTNVKFTIANEYSYCLSDSLNADGIVTDGNLPKNANVRFGWNSKTNELSRAYIAGSSTASDRYLVLIGDEKLTDLNDQNFHVSGLNDHEAVFADKGNWIYQLDAKAGKGASIRLIATYNENVQTFFNTSSVALAEEGNDKTYPVRFIYDFKTNNLMAAWLLLNDSNIIEGGSDLNANMMIMRKHHEQAQQIQLNADLTAVRTAYGVMTFDKYFLNNRDENGNVLPKAKEKSIYERALYWISFPFDVCIRDVFGFGEYMDTWIMEYYDGEARARNGAWVDSESYWTYMTNVNDTLKAGVGYVLCLDLDKMNYKSSVWDYTAEVSLYFPSAKPIGTIDEEQAVSVTLRELPCSIERDNRRTYDSNWHVIGVPRFINLDIELTNRKQGATQDDVIFYYEYIPATDDYKAAQSTGQKTFQTMQAYMVQYAGTIHWWDMATWETPQQIAARRNADSGPEKVSLRLEIAQDETAADKTFIQLQEEGATADFDMNKDLTKIINAGANIYTLVGEGNIQTAGNVLPMGECEVPVGVKVDAAGEYTFRMPDGTEGMVVELIDYYTNTRTNLLLCDYTITLPAGTSEDRFALHIQPTKSGVATDIDQLTGSELNAEGVQKYIIDGCLYLKKDGVLYDAQGHSRSAVGVR